MARHSRMLLLIFIFAHLMRIFGIFPYRYDLVDHLPRVSRGWRIYSGVLLSLYIITFTTFWLYSIMMFNGNQDHLMDFVRISEVVIITISYVAIAITEQCFFTQCATVTYKVHQQIREIIQEFIKVTPLPLVNYWIHRRVAILAVLFSTRTILLAALCVTISMHKFHNIFVMVPEGPNYVVFIVLVLPFVGYSLASSKFCAYVHALDHGFKLLNKQIELIVGKLNATVSLNQSHHHQRQKANEGGVAVDGDRNESAPSGGNLIKLGHKYEQQKLMFEFQEMVHRVRLKHDALCDLTEEFFRHWALFVLVFLIANFCTLVIEAFFLFTNVHHSIRTNQQVDMDFALLNMRACVMCAFELTWTIATCSNLMNNMRRIGSSLNALVLQDLDAGVVQSIEVWTIKLLSQPNAVQVYQLFDINNGLLYSVS